MRLYEITTPLTPDKFEPGQVPSRKSINFGMDNQEEIGSGIFGTAFSTPEEPGTVRKVVGPLHNLDAYFKYLQLISKNERFTNNPYFPKIFDLQVKQFQYEKDERPYYMYAVDMERLHPLDTLSDKEIELIVDRIFYAEKAFRWSSNELADVVEKVLRQTSRAKIPAAKRSKFSTAIKDTKFKHAVLLLQSLFRKEQFSFDIHTGNLMVRRGPGGPQLVITDPVA